MPANESFENNQTEMPVEDQHNEDFSNENVESTLNQDDLENDENNVPRETDSNDNQEFPEHQKQHFRKRQKKLESENRTLRRELDESKEVLQQILARQSGGMQPQQEAQEVDEVTKKVYEVLQQQESYKQQQQKAAELNTLRSEFEAKMDEAADRYDDFDIVHDERLPISESMATTALMLPNPGDVLYSLAKNPTELARISQLSPTLQAKAMWQHSVKLGSTMPKKVSNAPRPSDNLLSKPGSSSNVASMSYEEIKKRYKR